MRCGGSKTVGLALLLGLAWLGVAHGEEGESWTFRFGGEGGMVTNVVPGGRDVMPWPVQGYQHLDFGGTNPWARIYYIARNADGEYSTELIVRCESNAGAEPREDTQPLTIEGVSHAITICQAAGGPANLRFAPKEGWSAAVFVTSEEGGTVPMDVMSVTNTVYINYAYVNAGYAAVIRQCVVSSLLDDEGRQIDGGGVWMFEELGFIRGMTQSLASFGIHPFGLPWQPGEYTLRVVLDYYGDVEESDESDNVAEVRFRMGGDGGEREVVVGAEGGGTTLKYYGRRYSLTNDVPWIATRTNVAFVDDELWVTRLEVSCEPNPGAAREGMLTMTMEDVEFRVKVRQNGGAAPWFASIKPVPDGGTGFRAVARGGAGVEYRVEWADSPGEAWNQGGNVTGDAEGNVVFDLEMPEEGASRFWRLARKP